MEEAKTILRFVFPLVAIGAAVVESYFDANGEVKEHFFSASVRVVVAIAMSIYLFTGAYYIVIYAIMLLVSFWVFFDPCYNVFKGNKTWYIGNSEILDITARKVFKEEGGFNYLAFKLWLVVMLLIAFSF